MCEAMKTAMTQITYSGLTGANITWSADGEPTKDPKAVVITNGFMYQPSNYIFRNQ